MLIRLHLMQRWRGEKGRMVGIQMGSQAGMRTNIVRIDGKVLCQGRDWLDNSLAEGGIRR